MSKESEVKSFEEAQEKITKMNKEVEVKSFEEAQEKIAELNKDSSLNKPSDKEVKQAAAKFEKAKSDFESKKFKIGTLKQADDIYDFILDFMENHVYWTKNGWMGVLKMHEELTANKKAKKPKEYFSVGYQALEFMFYAISNPGGTGLKSAKAVEKVAEFYGNVIEMTGKVLEKAREELKDIQWLGDKAASMAQGFYLEKEDGTKEAQFASPSADDLLNQ